MIKIKSIRTYLIILILTFLNFFEKERIKISLKERYGTMIKFVNLCIICEWDIFTS